MKKPRKPRTVTGRVARHLRHAVVGAARIFDGVGRLEYVLMLVCAQAARQGLEPIDFDNDRGEDAFHAIFLAVAGLDPELILVTPAWRRVVISARNGTRPGPRDTPTAWRNTRSSSDDLDLRTSS